MTACPTPRCTPPLKRSYFISITGTAFKNIEASSDCSIGLLLLTDDAGFLDTDDQSLGAWLTDTDRVKRINGTGDVARHFSPCTSTYDDLMSFFGMTAGRGSRSRTIQVGFVDRANGETLSDAHAEIIKCPVCAWTIVPTLFNTDGDAYADTTELNDYAKLVRAGKEFDIKVPTFQTSLAFSDPFETTSQAALAANQGVDAEYVLSSYYCDVQRDSDCNAFVNPAAGDPDHNAAYAEGDTIPEYKYSNDALLVGAIASSYSQNHDNYNWTEFMKPVNFGATSTATGNFLDETTGDPMVITESEAINATSISDDGNFVSGATRSFSFFAKTQDGVTYIESLRANRKQFADIWYKERAVNEDIQKAALQYMAGKHASGLSNQEARELAARIKVRLRGWVGKNVINPAEYDWEANGYDNIISQSDGFVITFKPLSDVTNAQFTQRNGYALGVCFIVNEPQHRAGFSICEVSVLTSEVTG